MRTFLFAWNFLTTIRIGRGTTIDNPGHSAGWFPVVGLVMGAVLSLVNYAAGRLFPDQLSAAVLLVAWILLTGGLHLDGFIDCCDGILPSVPPERRLEIMKDSRVGAFGVLGAICLLLLKYSILASTAATVRGPMLILAPIVARTMMVWTAWRYPLARQEGFAAWFRLGLGGQQVLVAAALSLASSILLSSWTGLSALLLSWLLTVLLAAGVLRRIPGVTGDVYGAVNEVIETFTLLAVAGLQGPLS